MSNIQQDRDLIKSYGGATNLAKKINYQVGRVQNWKVRGIPAAEKLKFPELFLNIDSKKQTISTS